MSAAIKECWTSSTRHRSPNTDCDQDKLSTAKLWKLRELRPLNSSDRSQPSRKTLGSDLRGVRLRPLKTETVTRTSKSKVDSRLPDFDTHLEASGQKVRKWRSKPLQRETQVCSNDRRHYYVEKSFKILLKERGPRLTRRASMPSRQNSLLLHLRRRIRSTSNVSDCKASGECVSSTELELLDENSHAPATGDMSTGCGSEIDTAENLRYKRVGNSNILKMI